MNIIIIGCGTVGSAICMQLSKEGHDITVVDDDPIALEHAQKAVSMEPGNQIYRSLLQQLQSGSRWYSSRQQTYGAPVTGTGHCMRLCATYLCLNAMCSLCRCGR